MTDKTKASLKRGALWLAPFLISGLGLGAERYDASLMKASRFVQDSAVIMNRDSAWKASVMARFDRLQDGQDSIASRLTQMNCGDAVRKGCR